MRPLRLTVAALAAACVLTGCAAKRTLSVSDSLPAARGTVKFKEEPNDNTRIDLRVEHLAEPGKLTPPAGVYVAWISPDKSKPPQNIGALVVDEDLTGRLETVTPLHEFELFVTAEAAGQVQEPAGRPLLWTQYRR